MLGIRPFLTFLLLFFTLNQSFAQEEWQIVLLNKADLAVESELANANQTVEDVLSAQLINGSFEISDKSSLGIAHSISDDELAKKHNQNVNIALRYHIDLSEIKGPAVTQWTLSLNSYLVDLETKKRIETHNDKRTFSDLPNNCEGQCFYDYLSVKASGLAQDAGAIYVEKLDSLPRRYRYVLEFKDFAEDELVAIGEHLGEAQGAVYVTLLNRLPAKQQYMHQVGGHRYRYVSEMSANKLDITLSKKLSELGIPTLAESNDGRSFKFKRTSMPYLGVYIAVIGVLLLSCYFIYARSQITKHGRVLAKHAHQNEYEQWLDHYRANTLVGVRRPIAWFEQEKQAADAIKKSKQLSEQAWLLADQGEYKQAQLKVTEAIQLNADNKKANELKDNIVDYQRGFERYQKAENEYQSHPEQALSLLDEAIALNPHLTDKITKLRAQSQKNLLEQIAKNTLNEVDTALNHGDSYLALSLIDKALKGLDPDIATEQIALLHSKRNTAIENIDKVTGPITTIGDIGNCKVFISEQIQVGRKIEDPSTGFAIQYKRVSRASKQNLISRKGNSFFVEDLGSANGSCYDGNPLVPHQQVKLTQGKILALGGVNGQPGICRINTHISGDAGSLVLTLNEDATQFIDDTGIGTAWPTLDADLDSRWVMLGESLDIALDEEGNIDIGAVSKNEPIARLVYLQGYHLKITSGHEHPIFINGHPMHGLVPIDQGATITIGNQNIQLRSTTSENV